LDREGAGAEEKEEVVVKVVGLVVFRRDAVDVGGEEYGGGGVEGDACFLEEFADGGVGEGGVSGFDVAAGEEPAVEPPMMQREDAGGVGGDDEGGSSDVSGDKLVAGERIGRLGEEEEGEFEGLISGQVAGGQRLQEGEGIGDVGHKRQKPPG
jgi:hypothetical protein